MHAPAITVQNTPSLVLEGPIPLRESRLRKESAKSYTQKPGPQVCNFLSLLTKEEGPSKPTTERNDGNNVWPFPRHEPAVGRPPVEDPWRLSRFQKRRHRLRLRAVDSVVATLDAALAKKGQTLEAIERWKAEMPIEEEMLPRDKYTMFDRKEKKYRKGIHKLPKWTRVSQRVNPPGY
ncbi:hypothetical protein TgHK011_009238 [Trichoderma gracile]|nr:hypothetical protein TgHK011_009238 [Trichoderma gracile]